MNEKQVKAELAKYDLNWDDFLEFMIGQTISSDPNGNTIYWARDVKKFIITSITNIEPQDFD
jgi:hypothetical protein